MFKRVDIIEQEKLKGYSYSNHEGFIEEVHIAEGNIVELLADDSPLSQIYTCDIPKLIMALQAAYDHLIKEGY